MFSMYFELGFEHIADINGYDHILFILALCTVYLFKDWKKILMLVTAFTVGHSITLALAVLNIINFPVSIIEFLIPITIFISAFTNFFYNDGSLKKLHNFKYLTALFFGLIHGLGFSFYLKSLLGSMKEVVLPLFAFNIGLEVGQIFIVIFFLFITFIAVNLLRVPRRDWVLITSGAIAGISIMYIIENCF